MNNRDGEAGYHPLGEELWQQSGRRVDAFVHAVSTAHSIHGTAHALRGYNPQLRVFAVEPEGSAVLSAKPSGSHKIEGIGIGFLPPRWRPKEVDEILTVSTEDAKNMARRLAKEEAVFGGDFDRRQCGRSATRGGAPRRRCDGGYDCSRFWFALSQHGRVPALNKRGAAG